jgi:cytochrome c
MSRARFALRLLPGLIAALPLMAHAADEDPAQLAVARGCVACHRADRVAQSQLAPAPSWQDVADRYRGKPDALKQLTAVVLAGSTWRPSERHWAGKAQLGAMPPNTDINLRPEEARRLVRWILAR